MGDRIVFLGTGGDAIVVGKQYRASGGIILQTDAVQLHIDPGPGAVVMANMYEINLRENTAVLVSHNHINHANDVNAVISAMTHNGLDKRGVLISSKSALHGNEDDGSFINEFYKNCVEKFIAVDSTSKIGINSVDIRITPTKHSDPHTVGFKINTERFSVGYTSDSAYTAELGDSFANTDILIINVPCPSGISEKNNMNRDDATKLLLKVKPKLAVITHFGIKMLQADPLYEAREMQKATGIQTIAAKDGMIINPVSFSNTLKQKTLKSY